MSQAFPGTSTVVGGFNYPHSGPNNAIEYMASGLPYVTSSVSSGTAFKIDFPYVTSEIYIHVSGAGNAGLRIGFTENGLNGSNYFVVEEHESPVPYRIRCKEIFVKTNDGGGSVSYSIMAALTTIPNRSFPTLTGSAADPITGRSFFNSGSQDFVFGYKGLDYFP